MINVNANELMTILGVTPPSHNIMISGLHGIGKSEIVKNFYESKGERVVTMFCSQAADPGDIIGLPNLNKEIGITEFMPPWWFPIDGKPVVLFLDELNRARPEILQVVMDLTLNRKLAGKSLPEGSRIIAAVNDGDEYQLTELDPALLSRFNIYNFKPTASDWIKWASDNDVNPIVISFISTNTKYLDPDMSKIGGSVDSLPDRRSWVRVSDILKKSSNMDTTMKKIICGIVGSEAGVAFHTYASSALKVTPEDVIYRFGSVESKLAGYDMVALTGINDMVCSFADRILTDDFNGNSDAVRDGLMAYMTSLCGGGILNREAMAHLISNFETGKYSRINILISMNPNTLEKTIDDFVMNSGKTL